MITTLLVIVAVAIVPAMLLGAALLGRAAATSEKIQTGEIELIAKCGETDSGLADPQAAERSTMGPTQRSYTR